MNGDLDNPFTLSVGLLKPQSKEAERRNLRRAGAKPRVSRHIPNHGLYETGSPSKMNVAVLSRCTHSPERLMKNPFPLPSKIRN